jgi:hypothetical protein
LLAARPPLPRSFLSVSYDRHVKLWDTETGAALLSVTHGKVPYCATWYPQDNGVFLVGSANRKIMQYDARSGEVALEYNYHLGAVDTVTFVDDGRRIGACGGARRRARRPCACRCRSGVFVQLASHREPAPAEILSLHPPQSRRATTRSCLCGTSTRPSPSSTSPVRRAS